MSSRLAPLVVGAATISGLVTACSLILDTSDLPRAVDAFVPPDANLDANPSALSIMAITPSTIDEAAGTGGARPALVYVETNNLLSNATVSLAWADGGEEDPPVLVESMLMLLDGGGVGLSIQVPELAALDEVAVDGGDPVTRDIAITITQSSGADSFVTTGTITVKGHDALQVTANVDTGSLDPDAIYTSVTIGTEATGTGQTIRATGTRPLVYNAVGAITVWANLDANADGQAAGAGGCAGGLHGEGSPLLGQAGSPGVAGGCGSSGGAGGTQNGGKGGGGGFGTDGDGGPGIGGAASGGPMMVPFTAQPSGPNHGNGGGGGGGGAGTILGAGPDGGDGGGGGGAIALTAGGAVAIHGAITANGGAGADAGGSDAGAGGGGSGGAIVLRSGAPITGATITADGGASDGNAGAPGRIRIDAPQTSGIVASPPLVLGPAWPAQTPTLVDTPSITLQLEGTGCHGVIGATVASGGCAAPADALLDAEVTLDLLEGVNHICALWDTTAVATPTQTLREATSCVDVVYLPQ